MLRHRHWVGIIVAVGLIGILSVGCGSNNGSSTPQTGIRIHNNATDSMAAPNIHVVKRVDIGGTPATVSIPPGGTLFMPTAPGLHVVNLVYTDNFTETGQLPPDPVFVAAGQSVYVDFVK